ncbi:MAG: ribosomal protein S18-alanine N-acetyltransferase [Firmicutes bacterium]|jgi:ribosomal-protein-alanine N-acetyltransferase|uniref:Ribosomal-protein-alanine N-acetyltransferase n=1 Tax=Sulfobacillus benefaciens TaxID=453960 RepID=A0A2T2X1F6_9FIRM|nr:ribosomal protein S18-alanine N-acetyltransferase [Bacillota bacterium]MCL5012850.1 ribosomal protein S18-alanine N-acetyltransferase [Bacillota bacterium]PSR28321.1 MAG: ribosomal-protein-alanine N-acetyltransferase [Sulfobacillus benefaciens]HBQ95548.1 ribosomal-protein-alanine N-acetyltransferase [Sulfobacillus sp.]
MAVNDDRVPELADSSPDIVIRDMYMADLDAVLGIESHSFTTPWSRNAFQTELLENTFATYLVVEFHGKVVAYGGMWIILDEAHVTNIAVHPDYRGHHLGEAIMVGLMARAKHSKVVRMTLEVRRGNLVAQNLYNKLGFVQLGVRRGYYTDTREDAFIMWKDPL